MAQTLTRLLVHLVYSTKHRAPLISPTIADDLYKYTCGIARNHASPVLAIGGMPDHIHILLSQSKTIALATLVQHLKRDTSKWIKTRSPDATDFTWQEGYGVFTIGESQVDALTRYIHSQPVHHADRSFQDEFRDLLSRYNIAYDEEHVWS